MSPALISNTFRVAWISSCSKRIYETLLQPTVQVKYAGFFAESGELFDTSIEEVAKSQDKFDQRRKDAIGYNPLGTLYSPEANLITGFKEGLQLMSIGDKMTVFIPSHLGYGPSGYPGFIPPNSDLVFELELVGIIEPQK